MIRLHMQANPNSYHLVMAARRLKIVLAGTVILFATVVSSVLAVAVDEDTAATRTRLRELLPGVDGILFVKRPTL